ncbi:cell wall-active antibiotics response protein LiaF [Bacillus xiapuensis]|uniref:cell wall-active antibiotics response protein LiaF n=1 Tax=Bacillus xiapuensis TaxID=2014075 RepID=UPI000C24ACEF|nr:cell wall-active antibiotics response protein LiaF [Bacillus xiapuensis]
MSQLRRTDLLTIFLLAALLAILIEATLYQAEFVFPLFLGVAMIYFGRKWKNNWFGRLLFWIGLLNVFMLLLSLSSLRMVFIAGLMYIIYRLVQSKKHPAGISLTTNNLPAIEVESSQSVKHPFMKSRLFAVQSTPEHPYEWKDIHIQGGIGDITVNLSNTVLPKGTAVISIRQAAGKVKVDIPYETPVRIRYTALAGNAYMFQRFPISLWNDTFYYEDHQLAEKEGAETVVVILVSTLFGDLEVNRV